MKRFPVSPCDSLWLLVAQCGSGWLHVALVRLKTSRRGALERGRAGPSPQVVFFLPDHQQKGKVTSWLLNTHWSSLQGCSGAGFKVHNQMLSVWQVPWAPRMVQWPQWMLMTGGTGEPGLPRYTSLGLLLKVSTVWKS